jgi:hypothetical protein
MGQERRGRGTGAGVWRRVARPFHYSRFPLVHTSSQYYALLFWRNGAQRCCFFFVLCPQSPVSSNMWSMCVACAMCLCPMCGPVAGRWLFDYVI